MSHDFCHTISVTRFLSHNFCHANSVTRFLSHDFCHTISVTRFLSHEIHHATSITQILSREFRHTNSVTQIPSRKFCHANSFIKKFRQQKFCHANLVQNWYQRYLQKWELLAHSQSDPVTDTLREWVNYVYDKVLRDDATFTEVVVRWKRQMIDRSLKWAVREGERQRGEG